MFASQLLLVLALAAVGAAALRIASLTGARGLELGLAAAAVGGTIVVLESLALGLVSLGGEPAALGLAAAATWLLAWRLVPRRDKSPAAGGPPARARALGPARLVAAGAVAGLVLAWTAWLLRNPFIGFDGLTYHLGTVVAWIHDGRPGAQVPLFQSVPIESYPLTTEVMLTWVCALARSYAPAMAAMVAFTGLAAAGGWGLLRRLGVDRLAGALAVAALVALPFVAGQANLVNTDVPALAWLLCAAALAAGARSRPALLAPALLAGGLCLGSKTTPAPMLVAALAAGGWAARARLRPLAVPLALAALAAVLAGGLWYVRNLLQHGSPVWPFVALPGGDPVPSAFKAVEPSFLSHPAEMLRGNVGAYARALGGGVILLAGIVAAPLLARRRRVLGAAALTAFALLVWMNAPYTGIQHPTQLATGATRYLLSAYAAGALALALAATDAGPVGRALALALLAGSVIFSVARDHLTGFPLVPPTPMLAAGVLAGALLATAGARLQAPARMRESRAATALAVVLTLAATTGLALGARGFGLRHARTGAIDAGVVRFLAAPGASARDTVWMSPGIDALAAGDRLRRTVRWFPVRTPCVRLRRYGAQGVVIVAPAELPAVRACLHAQPRYLDARFAVF